MKTFVLAAGEGTRLFPINQFIPKAMLYVGGTGNGLMDG